MYRFLFISLITVLLVPIAGCSAAITMTPDNPPVPIPTGAGEAAAATPTSGAATPMVLPASIAQARQALARQKGWMADQITLVRYEAVQWRDACLGLAVRGEMCAQVVTPGFKILFASPAGQTEVHSDDSGTNIRIAGN